MEKESDTIEVEFAAMRISKSSTLMLNGELRDVFPLFTPIHEKEWAAGWEPEILYGGVEIKEGGIFRTPSYFDEGEYFLWIISKYDEHHFLIQYTVTSPGRVWFIEVQCKPYQSKTLATITYIYTGLNAEGHERNKVALGRIFANNLADWENAINYFLKTGKKLTH